MDITVDELRDLAGAEARYRLDRSIAEHSPLDARLPGTGFEVADESLVILVEEAIGARVPRNLRDGRSSLAAVRAAVRRYGLARLSGVAS